MTKLTEKDNISLQNVSFPEKSSIMEMLKTQIKADTKTIVAISGGPDSMLTATLTYNFFVNNKYNVKNLYFVHFNHKIRRESDQEEQFIKTYFAGTNLQCSSLDKGRLGGIGKTGKEESLRNRRYAELQKLVKKTKADCVILGHNLSDRIESTFLNLLRGAGLKGFSSMEFSESHHLLGGTKVLRPLIELAKSTITDVCKKNHIPYVVDASNNDNETSLRNKLRNTILPSFYALSKNKNSKETFEQSMLKTYQAIEKMQIESLLIRREGAERKGGLKPHLEWGWGVQPIKQSPFRKVKFAYKRNIPQKAITIEHIVELLQQIGISNNISSAFLSELQKFLKSGTNGYKYFQKTYFFIAHGNIYIIQAPEDFRKKSVGANTIRPNINATIRQAGANTIRQKFRYPQPGDRYKGKTRNQYCITQKIPIFRRNFVAVLEKDGKIVKVIKPT